MAKDAGGWRREVALHVVNLDTSRAPLSVLALATTLITDLAEKNWPSVLKRFRNPCCAQDRCE